MKDSTMVKIRSFDAAEYLDSPETVVAYLREALNEALDTGDIDLFLEAIGDAARARGMSEIADEIGVNRGGLYKSLEAGGNPGFGTIAGVMKALGARLDIRPS
jgi:probable addiction module antidote protein